MVLDFLSYILSFIVIWFGAGLILNGISDFSQKLHISAFASSFFILGILTSIPEASVGINSIIDKDPEIFVGNLLGASLVMFILIIPILAIIGNSITLSHQMDDYKLPFALLVITAPVLFTIDQKVSAVEAVILIVLYAVLFYLIEKKKGLMEIIKKTSLKRRTHLLEDMTKIITGAILVYLSSSQLVDKTILFSRIFQISPYVLSLLLLSVGTNLPELSLTIRSVTAGAKEVALGSYMGSAAANTLFFGILTLSNRKELVLQQDFLPVYFFTILGLGLFYYFTRSKKNISRKEGLILIFVYSAFVIFEITRIGDY